MGVWKRHTCGSTLILDAETFEESGQDTIVVNYTMKLRSGKMRICGTFSLLYQPLSRTATFDGTWRGNVNAAGFTARAVGDGTFGLERSKMKIDLQPLPPDQIPSEIQAILGQSPWTECAVVTGVGHWTGFVRVRSQD